MNAVHMHLLLNHFPVIGTLLGGAVLLWGTLKQQVPVQKTGAFLLLLMAIVAIPVYLTGEPAEDAVENLPGLSENMVELHEEAAGLAMVIMELTGIAAAWALWLSWKNAAKGRSVFWVAAVLSLFSFAAMARTGYYGGKIRHTEIRSGVVAPTNAEPGVPEKEDDD